MKHIPGIGEAAGTPLRNDTKIAEGSYVDANTLNNPSFECENLTKMLLGNDSPKAFDPDTLQNGDQIAKGVKAALIGLEFQKEHQTSKENQYVLEYPDLSHILGDEKLNVIKEFTAGMKVMFIVKHSNTGASTLTVFGLTAKPIKKENGTKELEAGDLLENSLVELIWVQIGVEISGGYWELITKNRKNITEYIEQYISDNVVDKNTDQEISGSKVFIGKSTYDGQEFLGHTILRKDTTINEIYDNYDNIFLFSGMKIVDKNGRIESGFLNNIIKNKNDNFYRQETIMYSHRNSDNKKIWFGIGFDGKNGEKPVAICHPDIKKEIAHWSSPSNTKQDFQIQASGATYIAPFDGWMYVDGNVVPNISGHFVRLKTNTISMNNYVPECFIPVFKGQAIQIFYYSIARWNRCFFVKNQAGV